ncbi:hypothetical protein AC230_02225 [Streptomyces caatingaensis]|uniref:Uncharacterized protein n=1 Tax=Streptomyces caatingaensis TaxID=1678637 RepID=A0A0K9XLF4_9ACTN|nr:hypothetical protein AC230_02225 [Streptomyces caatingaensis]
MPILGRAVLGGYWVDVDTLGQVRHRWVDEQFSKDPTEAFELFHIEILLLEEQNLAVQESSSQGCSRADSQWFSEVQPRHFSANRGIEGNDVEVVGYSSSFHCSSPGLTFRSDSNPGWQ